MLNVDVITGLPTPRTPLDVALQGLRGPVRFGSGGPVIPSMTNAQKLSLPANTPVGTRVQVTDGFVVSGASEAVNVFWFNSGLTYNGRAFYRRVDTTSDQLVPGAGLGNAAYYDINTWVIENPDGSNNYVGQQDVSAPWLITSWTKQGNPATLTLTHPAVQELTAPSTAQGGVFVSGGTQDGIYKKQGTFHGKDWFMLLGDLNNDPGISAISWDDSGHLWLISDSSNVGSYYSLSDVATPDLVVSNNIVFTIDFNGIDTAGGSTLNYGSLKNNTYPIVRLLDSLPLASSVATFDGTAALFVIGVSNVPTPQQAINKIVSLSGGRVVDLGGLVIQVSPSDHNLEVVQLASGDYSITGEITTLNNGWKNASDDSPALITVTSISVGELNAGVLVVGAGTANRNGPYIVNSPYQGKNFYAIVSDDTKQISWEPSGWQLAALYHSSNNSVLPTGTWATDAGTPPAPTVTRDDVASEQNWSVVP